MKPMDNARPLYINAACLVEEWIYFASINSSWLFRLNVETNDLEALHILSGTKTGMKFSGLYYYNGMIWMIPWNADYIYVYKINESVIEQLPLPDEITGYSNSKQFRKSIIQGKYLWLLPCEYPGIVRVDMEDKTYKIFNDWPAGIFFDKSKKMNFKMMTLYENELYLFNDGCNMSIKMSTVTGEMTEWKAGCSRFFGTISRNKLYTAPVTEFEPVKIIDLESNRIIKDITLPDKIWLRQPYLYCYWYTKIAGNKLFYMPHDANGIIMMDLATDEVNILDTNVSDYDTIRPYRNYAVYDILPYKEKYLAIPYQGSKIVLINDKGKTDKEYLTKVDSKYMNIDFTENDMFSLKGFADIIRCTDYKKINWNNINNKPAASDIGQRIHRMIRGN